MKHAIASTTILAASCLWLSGCASGPLARVDSTSVTAAEIACSSTNAV